MEMGSYWMAPVFQTGKNQAGKYTALCFLFCTPMPANQGDVSGHSSEMSPTAENPG